MVEFKDKVLEVFDQFSNKKIERVVTLILVFSFLIFCAFQFPLLKSSNLINTENAFAEGTASQVVAGSMHTCALKDDGSVWCWGDNEYGQVGNNTNNGAKIPTQVVGAGGADYLTNVKSIAAGGTSTCAVKIDGSVWCWGDNGDGQLGDGNSGYNVYSNVPVQVLDVGGSGNLAGVDSVVMDGYTTCALKSSGTVFCWGNNYSGSFGDGTTDDSLTPVQVLGVNGTGVLGGITQIAIGSGSLYAIKTDGTLYSWGYNGDGQLGNGMGGSYDDISTTPVQVVGVDGLGYLDNVKSVDGGAREHACAVKTDGTVFCWGGNQYGEFGDGTTYSSLTPIQVVGAGGSGYLTGVSNIAASFESSCVSKTDGTVYCWGTGRYLGAGNISSSYTPIQTFGVEGVGTLADITSVVAGDYFNMAVSSEGKIYGWGENEMGNLGDSTTTFRYTPVKVVSAVISHGYLTNVIQSDVAANVGCAVRSDGSVWCWGDGQPVPIQVRGEGCGGYLTDIKSVSVGSYYDDWAPLGASTITVLGFFKKYFAQILLVLTIIFFSFLLAYFKKTKRFKSVIRLTLIYIIFATALAFFGATFAQNISENPENNFFCAVKTDGTVYCWGYNENGQLGNGTTDDSACPVQVLDTNGVDPLINVDIVTSGSKHACALKLDATVYCWGYNENGQLGNGTTDDSLIPIQVFGSYGTEYLTDVKSVSAGHFYTCAVKTDGTVFCWGDNEYHQLGDNAGEFGQYSVTDILIPTQVTSFASPEYLTGVASVAKGIESSCALKTDGTVYCWGSNSHGEIGDGTTGSRAAPIQVHGPGNVGYLTGVSKLSMSSYSACVLKTDDTVWCWGGNWGGQLGDGTTNDSYVPIQVLDPTGTGYLTGISSITQGAGSVFAIKTDGTVYGWGSNNGMLGDGTTTDRSLPVQVLGADGIDFLTGIKQVSVGEGHSCALGIDGSVYCWGSNSNGQLGNNLTPIFNFAPVQVHGVEDSGFLTDVKSIGVGGFSSCAIKNDETVFCWGDNTYGQIGDNTATERDVPVQVLGVDGLGYLAGVSGIVGGWEHTCAVKTDGSVYCWGNNTYGLLGDNTTNGSATPIQVHGVGDIGFLAGAESIDIESYSSCALKTDGTLYCWGYNNAGQLGDNTKTDRHTPVQVVKTGYLDDIQLIAAGDDQACALSNSGTVFCWGSNDAGQLGNGTGGGWSDYSASAVQVLGLDGEGYLEGIEGISSGLGGSCALTIDGNVFCWGANSYGQLGNGAYEDSYTPVQVLGADGLGFLDNISEVAKGGHTCAVKDDETAYCWGSNTIGELGNNWTESDFPVQVWGDGIVFEDFALFSGGSDPDATTTTTTTTVPEDPEETTTTTTIPGDTTTTTTVPTDPGDSTTTTTIPEDTTTSTTIAGGEITTTTTKPSSDDPNNKDGFIGNISDSVASFLSSSESELFTFISHVSPPLANLLSSSANELYSFIAAVPPSVARTFPWLLFALLAYLIRRLIKQTSQEGKNAKEMIELVELEKTIGVQKENFVRLSSHYLRTPLTIISAGIDLMFTLDKVEKDKQGPLTSALAGLNNKVEAIFADISANKYLNNITIPDIKQEKIKVYTSLYLWLPIVLVGLVSLFTNYLFVHIAKIDLYTINLLTEVVAFILLAQLFFSAFRKRQTQRIKNQKYELELKQQKIIDDARNAFMDGVARGVNTEMIPLETVLPSVGTTEHKTEIYKGLSDLKQMVYKFTLLGSLRSEGTLVTPRESNIKQIADDFIKIKQDQIKQKNLKVNLSKNNLSITTDKDKLIFIILSLLDNAIKFSKDKGTIDVKWAQKDSLSIITVEDNGIGMTKEAKELLFKPFVRGTSTLTFDYEGMGTNLYIAKQIANYLGGDISIESKLGKGTKATVFVESKKG